MPLSRYCKIYDQPNDPDNVLLFSTWTMASLNVQRSLLREIETDGLSAEDRVTLAAHGFLMQDAAEERREMLSYIDRMNTANRTMRFVVVLNLDCNLACTYCFEGTRKGKYFLSEKTASELIGFMQSRIAGKDEINITFYGGEPLMSADMIVRISEQIRSLVAARPISYAFNLITNGTLLTRRVVEQLKPIGLHAASVTLDGPQEVHNATRPFKSGAGSFETIIRNLRDVHDLIDLKIGGNFTQTNYREFPKLFDVLIASGLGPDALTSLTFDPVFNETADFTPDFHGGCSCLNEPWLAEAGLFLRNEIMSRGFPTPELQPTVCMMERTDHLVVNWDGKLYKCTGTLGRDEFQAGTLKSGLNDYGPAHNLGNWKNEECLACSYLPMCFGGCRYMALLREGSMRGLDCKKPYFDSALQSLVLQDLKYGNTVKREVKEE